MLRRVSRSHAPTKTRLRSVCAPIKGTRARYIDTKNTYSYIYICICTQRGFIVNSLGSFMIQSRLVDRENNTLPLYNFRYIEDLNCNRPVNETHTSTHVSGNISSLLQSLTHNWTYKYLLTSWLPQLLSCYIMYRIT